MTSNQTSLSSRIRRFIPDLSTETMINNERKRMQAVMDSSREAAEAQRAASQSTGRPSNDVRR